MITVDVGGSFNNMTSFLKHASKVNIPAILHSSAQEGIAALATATPLDTGLAAHSWDYEVTEEHGVYTIYWTNDDVENGFHVVIALQYGYGTGTGGYVQGRDFINPAIAPVFDKIADRVWKAVTSG